MKRFFSWLMDIDSPDEDVRRRGRTIVILALGLIGIALVSIVPILFTGPAKVVSLIATFITLLVYMTVLVLARYGKLMLSALIFIASITLILLGSGLAAGTLTVSGYFLVLPVLIASLCLRPSQVWAVLAFVVAVFGLVLFSSRSIIPPEDPLLFVYVTMLLCLVALVSFLGGRSISGALRAADAARADAEVSARILEQAKGSLETMVAERTTALQAALAEVQARADEQALLLAELEQQRSTIREISVPVIPISATALVMPLVGALDTARMRQVQEQALHSIERSSARHLILDITGVPIVDNQVAQGLLTVMEMARLLGTQVMLVGIRPEVAQAIVGLGLNLQGIYTASDLQSALKQVAGKQAVRAEY